MRRVRLLMLAALFAVGIPAYSATAQADNRCFPQTGKCISGVIRRYWEANGGLAVFGYPITDLAVETNAEGFTGPTQWFERDRLEDQGGNVLAGRLGAQKLALEGRPWETLPKVNGAGQGCVFFAQTGHSLCPPFRAYWESNGGLARFGYPISEPVTERNADGYTGNFQWFERRRMEAHPENQPPFNILLGLLGNEVRAGGPAPAPVPPPQPGGDPCANIAAPTDAIIEPNCVVYGDEFYVEAFGFDANQEIGFWITQAGSNITIGTTQTARVDANGSFGGTISTLDWFDVVIPPGDYVFVAQDVENKYEPSTAPFRVIP